jgi:PAS domain S-box-containing protein
VSPSYRQVLGFAPADLQGTNALDHVHPDDVSKVQEVFVQGLQCEGTPVRVQFRYRDAGGGWRVIESTGSNHLSDPLIQGFVVNSRDVTERVEAEERLRESEARYRGIVEAAFDGLVITSPDGIIVEANPAAHRMCGYEIGDLIGMDSTALIHPDSLQAARTYTQTVGARGWADVSLTTVRKDGTPVHVEVRGTQFIYRSEVYRLAVVRDVTERVAAETAVREERQRLARELHDSVSQALYSIALGASTARALVETHPEQASEPLTFVLDQARIAFADLRALIFDLRPEGLERVGLGEALGLLTETLRARHGMDVQLALCSEPRLPIAVKTALYRIAQEALHNVVKHAEASTVHVSLTCSDEEVVLEVQDNGRGFDTEHSFPGHLGLETMKERAERLDGSREVVSAPGLGTIVRARLPYRMSA